MMRELEEYKVTSLEMAAVLASARIPMCRMEMTANKRVEFVFVNNGGVSEEAVRLHQTGELKMDTLTIMCTLANLKNQLFEFRRQNGLSQARY